MSIFHQKYPSPLQKLEANFIFILHQQKQQIIDDLFYFKAEIQNSCSN